MRMSHQRRDRPLPVLLQMEPFVIFTSPRSRVRRLLPVAVLVAALAGGAGGAGGAGQQQPPAPVHLAGSSCGICWD